MPAADYSQEARDALESILEAGDELVLTRKAGGTFIPSTGGVSGSTTQAQAVAAVSLPASGGTVQAFDDRMREEYVRGRLRFFLIAALKPDGTALDFDPQAGDLLTYLGKQWEVSGATPLAPSGTPILFNVGVMEGGRT